MKKPTIAPIITHQTVLSLFPADLLCTTGGGKVTIITSMHASHSAGQAVVAFVVPL
jgi:hypothetical protein